MLLIGLALPVEILITVLFWPLFFFRREALFSRKAVEAGLTIHWTVNVAQHLLPALILIVEFAVVSRRFRYSRSHVGAITAATLGYFGWMYFLFSKNKRWVYPLLHALTHFQRGLLLAASWALCMLVYQASTAPVPCTL